MIVRFRRSVWSGMGSGANGAVENILWEGSALGVGGVRAQYHYVDEAPMGALDVGTGMRRSDDGETWEDVTLDSGTPADATSVGFYKDEALVLDADEESRLLRVVFTVTASATPSAPRILTVDGFITLLPRVLT